jgi:hypothetical protein
LDGGPEGWTLTLNDENPIVDADPWFIANQLRYMLAIEATSRRADLVGLHAAVLTRGQNALLLMGELAAGKTTLSLDLARSGWSFKGDDFAPFDAATGTVKPFPKPLGVKNPERWDLYSDLWGDLHWPPRPEKPFLLPPGPLLDGPMEPVRPTLIAFPQFSTQERASWERLSPARVLALAASHTYPLGASTLPALAGMIKAAHGLRLTYSSSEEAISQLQAGFAKLWKNP